jgi:glycosyltransferase involved in cell wall biosynthesis
MRLTAIVPATDGPRTLARALKAIAAADWGPDELIVVDNASAPGPAAARNAGALQAGGDLLVFVDADVEVHGDAFVRIRQAFAADEDLTALFGSYDDDPEGTSLVSSFRNLLHHHVHQRSPGQASTFWVGLGAIRRAAFLGSGGFDFERYPRSSIEDIELGARLVRRGALIVLDPELQGKHLKRWTATTMIRTDLLRRGAPWIELLLRERRVAAALNLCWRSRASACMTGSLVWALARRSRTAAILATAGMLAVNGDLYALLVRRRGPRMAVAGPPLLALHDLTALASLPLGCAMFLLRLRRSPPRSVGRVGHLRAALLRSGVRR